MTIEQAIQEKLKAVLGHARVYPDAIPDAAVNANQWPCVVYEKAGDNEEFSLNDATPPQDHDDTYTLTIWGPDRIAVAQSRDTLKAIFAGATAQGLWSGIYVAGASLSKATASFDPAADGSDRHMRSETLSLQIFWYGS